MQNQELRVIGIAGASNGGKTTICKRIKSLENWDQTYNIIHMDDYYWPRDDPRHKKTELGTMLNFDCIEAVDWQKLIADLDREISTAKSNLKYLLIEGIFVCTHPEISKRLHAKIFLNLDYETMKFRRSQRKYPIPDEEGYFDNYVYPAYRDTLKDLQETVHSVPVHFVDGRKSKQQVFEEVIVICDDTAKLNNFQGSSNHYNGDPGSSVMSNVKVETC